MEKTEAAIEKMVEVLFQDCLFDSLYMDEAYAKERFRMALIATTETEWQWIVAKYKDKIKEG